MRISRIGRGRLLGLGLVAAVAVGGAAFAASNTVPDSNAGQGLAVVAGFHVSAVKYVADTDKSQIGAVNFTIARLGANSATTPDTGNATVYVRLQTGSGPAVYTSYVTCTFASVGSATCDTTGITPTFNQVIGLDVVAYDI